jgi:hypothetical protein
MSKTTLELYGTSSQLKLVQEGYLLYILYRALLRAASHSLIQLYTFILKNIHIELSPKVSQTGGTGPQFLLKWG